MKKVLLLLLLFSARPALAQNQKLPEGIWQGYDGEWLHVSQQLVALAEATPAEKFSWRPAPGVRSTSEVYMHIAEANFYLLSVTGPKMPADMKEGMDKSVTAKADVIKRCHGILGMLSFSKPHARQFFCRSAREWPTGTSRVAD